jgi:predicted lipid-binding transport protein (Tim44 family)
MGSGSQFVDIILFALVAGFLILRLRAVLGRRDGHDSRTPDPFAQPKVERSEDKVVRLPERNERPAEPAAAAGESAAPVGDALQAGLAQIKTADPRFKVDEFIAGCRVAFEYILNAFAAGEEQTLQRLLSPEVYANFANSIRERQAAGQRLETKLVTIKSAKPVEAYMAGRTAHVTIKFVSEQISTLYDAAGAVVEGDPHRVAEVTDFWTFARDTRSSNPNWMLVATGSVD